MKPCCHVNVLSFWDTSGAFDNQNRRLTLKYHATLDAISLSDNQNGWLTWLYYMPLDMISVSYNWNGSLTSLCYLSLDRIRHIIIEMEGSPCCTMQHILLRWNWVDFFIYEAINAEWTSCNLHTGLVLPCQVVILHRNEFWHLMHSKLKCTQPNSGASYTMNTPETRMNASDRTPAWITSQTSLSKTNSPWLNSDTSLYTPSQPTWRTLII